MPVPSMGWFAVCGDTEGNEFGLWQTDPNAGTLAETTTGERAAAATAPPESSP